MSEQRLLKCNCFNLDMKKINKLFYLQTKAIIQKFKQFKDIKQIKSWWNLISRLQSFFLF